MNNQYQYVQNINNQNIFNNNNISQIKSLNNKNENNLNNLANNVVQTRLAIGWSLERALTTPLCRNKD